jgi:hypothetical protein
MELDNLYFVGRPGADGQFENIEPTPEEMAVTISYDGPDGTPYEDTFNLDVGLLRQRTYVESSTSPEKQAKEALKLLKRIQEALVDISRFMSAKKTEDFEQRQNLVADAPSIDAGRGDIDQ